MAQKVRDIAKGVAQLPVSIANVYFVDSPNDKFVVVDAGTPGKGAQIREAAESRYGARTKPAAILLTHGHFDHAGSALELASSDLRAPARTAVSNGDVQQNLITWRISLIILRAPTNRLRDLETIVPAAVSALFSIGSGEVVRIG